MPPPPGMSIQLESSPHTVAFSLLRRERTAVPVIRAIVEAGMRQRLGCDGAGILLAGVAFIGVALSGPAGVTARENKSVITGVVTGERGPEAGVW